MIPLKTYRDKIKTSQPYEIISTNFKTEFNKAEAIKRYPLISKSSRVSKRLSSSIGFEQEAAHIKIMFWNLFLQNQCLRVQILSVDSTEKRNGVLSFGVVFKQNTTKHFFWFRLTEGLAAQLGLHRNPKKLLNKKGSREHVQDLRVQYGCLAVKEHRPARFNFPSLRFLSHRSAGSDLRKERKWTVAIVQNNLSYFIAIPRTIYIFVTLQKTILRKNVLGIGSDYRASCF
ncbi:hypothetical protein CEXT_534551 [Caerostris extrusa]|uniref:Uncharacterized protein n=1 Tax=Caerostris extrusa TaxID=172846 RepID=A0AAV4NYF3_CAEEX|nr:hypothetical protein CEXT_534551 [Caerostris extrusa]